MSKGLNRVRGRKIIKGLLLALLLCVPAAATAQGGGGKAEPLRIEIKRGQRSATIKDRIHSDVQAEYIFAARKGQRVRISLTSAPSRSAVFSLASADGEDFKFKYDGHTWKGVAPVTGDYLVLVKKSTGTPGRSNYSLTLTIE